jgi:glycosyltransferase involved in cell wall biosynthesis
VTQKTITAVLPTFQRSVLLRHAMASVLAQTWPDVVVSVFDNASTDDTSDVVARVAKTDSRVRYHRREANIGAIRNFSRAVVATGTPFFSVFSDDDVLLPDFYEHAMQAFDAHPGAMFVAMPTLEVDGSGTVRGGTGSGAPYTHRYFGAGEAFGRVPWVWTGWVFRKEIIEQIGFIQETAGPACDIGFIRHVSARFPGVVLPDVAALIRVHDGNVSGEPGELLAKANRVAWNALSEPIEQDAQVPESIRSTIRHYIEQMYVASLKRRALSSLIDRDEASAQEAAAALRHLGYGGSAALLGAATAACRLPFVSDLVRRAAQPRRNAQREEQVELARRFEPRREEFRRLLNASSPGLLESVG